MTEFNSPAELIRAWDHHQWALRRSIERVDDTNDFLTQQLIDDCRTDTFDPDVA